MNWQPGKQPIIGGHRIAERLAEVERQLAELKKFIQVSPTEVVIRSPKTVKIEAVDTEINGTEHVKIKALETEINGDRSVKINAADTQIQSAVMKIDGGLLKLPGGVGAVARVGDVVSGPSGIVGTILAPGNPQIIV